MNKQTKKPVQKIKCPHRYYDGANFQDKCILCGKPLKEVNSTEHECKWLVLCDEMNDEILRLKKEVSDTGCESSAHKVYKVSCHKFWGCTPEKDTGCSCRRGIQQKKIYEKAHTCTECAPEKPQSECKNCGGKGYNTVYTGIRISPDFPGDVEYNEKPKINKIPCRVCKATGVSTPQSEESIPHDIISEPTQDSWKDRFDELVPTYDTSRMLSVEQIRLAEQSNKKKETLRAIFKEELQAERERIKVEVKELPAGGYCSEYCRGAKSLQEDILELLSELDSQE